MSFGKLLSYFIFLFSLFQPEGLFVEWKAEEVPSSDEHDWAVVGNAVGYKLDRQSESGEDDIFHLFIFIGWQFVMN